MPSPDQNHETTPPHNRFTPGELSGNPAKGILNGPLSRLDLSEQTGLSPRTVTNVTGENSPAKYVRVIADNLDVFIANSCIQRESLLGIGIGVPGIVEHNAQVSVSAPM